MFNRKIFKKKLKFSAPEHIRKNNLIYHDKKKHLKGDIIFGHCRGHNTIIIFYFHFKGFLQSTLMFIS